MDRPTEQLRSILTGVVAIVFAMCVVAIAYFSSRPEPDASLTANSERAVANIMNTRTASPRKDTLITFSSKGFAPKKLTVKQGTDITFKNTSSANVQFSSSERSTKRVNTELNLKTLLPGESVSFDVNKLGTWRFGDSIGREFTGTLKVIQ